MIRRLTLSLALLATVALAAPAGAAVPLERSTDETFAVPADGTFTIKGRGYGHGHGMSQYGAEGAARQGLSAREIVDFYYPGTKLRRTHARIGVLITGDTSRDVKVRGDEGLSVRDRGTGELRRLPAKERYRQWKLDVRNGETALFWRNHGRWHRYRPHGLRHFRGDGEFRSRSHRLTLFTSAGKRVYRGTLRAASPSPGSSDRDTVNVLGIDSYLRGVVADEIPASWHPAAVQAQAIAARTYALFERAANRERHYDLCDTTLCQVYGGVAAEHPLADKAVRKTKGRFLRQHGEPAFTQFSASNGDWTSAGSQPYLPHRKDPYDRWSGNPYRHWSADVDASVLESRYPELGELTAIRVTEREGGGRWGGRVFDVTLVGTDEAVRISGDDLRYLYGLRSTWFDFAE